MEKLEKSEETGTLEFKKMLVLNTQIQMNQFLENISFKANRGETIAIIGSTGSGKKVHLLI
ncbi:MAG: hypothetical protein L6V81_11550 [Clostridium sp.]|nr:MAG: hypothetical protein L6V81_11550 [Clostridium sp.]